MQVTECVVNIFRGQFSVFFLNQNFQANMGRILKVYGVGGI